MQGTTAQMESERHGKKSNIYKCGLEYNFVDLIKLTPNVIRSFKNIFNDILGSLTTVIDNSGSVIDVENRVIQLLNQDNFISVYLCSKGIQVGNNVIVFLQYKYLKNQLQTMLFLKMELRVIVVLLIADNYSENITKEVFKAFAKKGYKDVTLLVQDTSGLVHIYTWSPYQQPSGSCGEFLETIHLDSCKDGKFTRNSITRQTEIIDNLKGCKLQPINMVDVPPLYTLTANYSSLGIEEITFEGVNSKLLEIVTEKLHMIYVKRLNKYTGTDTIKVQFSSIFSYQPENLFWHATPYYSFDLTFFVLHAEPYPRWSSLTRVFDWSSWVILFLSIFLVSVSMAFISRRESYVIDALNAWSLILGGAIPRMPSNTSLRMILLAWILTSMCLNTIYQTFVTSYYIEPGYQHQIDSLEELHNLDIPLVFESSISYSSHIFYVKEGSNNSFITRNKMGFLIMYFLWNPNSAVFSYEAFIRHYIKEFCDKNGGPKLHKFSKIFNQDHIGFYVLGNTFIQSKLNEIVLRLVEGGFPKKFEREVSNLAIISTSRTEYEYVPLSLTHIQSHFVFFFIGISLSFLALCFEIVVALVAR